MSKADKAEYKKFIARLNDPATISLATEYHQYMTYRAAKEKLAHELDVKFYATRIAAECSFFFGVYNNGHHLTHDIQQPKIFEEWLKSKE